MNARVHVNPLMNAAAPPPQGVHCMARNGEPPIRQLSGGNAVDAPQSTCVNLGRSRALTVFADTPDTVRRARDFAVSTLTEWGLACLVEDARLVVSELVGNVVQHAITDKPVSRIDVHLKIWPMWLFIGVSDEDSVPPDLPWAEPVSPELAGDFTEAVLLDSGRGLFIVQRLADAVWWEPGDGDGKTVWCRFDLDGRGDAGSP